MDVRGCRLLVALIVVVVAVGGAPVFAADPVAAQEDEPRPTGYDELIHEIELHDDGSATWTVEYRYRLDDGDDGDDEESDDVDWETLRDDVETREDAYLERFERSWTETLVAAENETDREMELSNVTLEVEESTTPPEYGTVRFTFEWESFAHVEVNRIEAGDALVGLDLDERTRLVVTWPESYDLRDNESSVEPDPDDYRETAVVWDGQETEFLEDEPRVELIEGDPSPEESERSVSAPWPVLVTAAILAAVGAASWLVVRRNGTTDGSSPEPNGGARTPDRDGPPRELLSNEEQVLKLLEERGGRVKQQEVVAELDWTEAKTSQVVNDLRQSGEVEVFRIGRENVLTRSGEDEKDE
ncbi:MAG: helix-turn-helix transcriptional regulator [Halorubrum sp.]